MRPYAMLSLAAVAVVAVVAALAPLAHAMPPRSVDLSEALNHTVCPIEVFVEVNPNRIPMRIKMLRCASNPKQWCRNQRIPDHECCQHNHDNHNMECVQMKDTVLVQFNNGPPATIDVDVGCSCLVTETSKAPIVSQNAR